MYLTKRNHNYETSTKHNSKHTTHDYRYYFPDSQRGGSAYTKVCQHSCVPYALAWGKSILAAGNDQQITFYDSDGGLERRFDYSDPEDGKIKCKEFGCGSFNQTGDSVVVGNFDSFYTFSYSKVGDTWEEKEIKVVENMYSVTALSWKDNGSTLGVGSLCGLVDCYEACVKRYSYKGFEITYVSPSQVLIRRKSEKSSVTLKR